MQINVFRVLCIVLTALSTMHLTTGEEIKKTHTTNDRKYVNIEQLRNTMSAVEEIYNMRLANIETNYEKMDRQLQQLKEQCTSLVDSKNAETQNQEPNTSPASNIYVPRNLTKFWFGKEKKRQAASTIAFYSKLDTHINIRPGYQPIVFDDVDTNVGGHYQNGIFTCSQPGVYLFLVTVVVRPHTATELEIMKNGGDVAYVYAGSDGSHFDSGTNFAILELQAGDKVWVRTNKYHDNDGDVIDTSFSAFAGLLIGQ